MNNIKKEKKKPLELGLEVRQNNREKKKMDFLEAFSNKANNVSLTCKSIGIRRSTFYKWLKEDEEFKEDILEMDEGDIDMAESALKRQIKDGNITAIIFYLKTKGKSRGYVERQELTGMNGQKLFEVKIVDNNE